MTDPLSAAQMRAIEATAISSGRVTGRELMERAGRGVVHAIFETWPALGPALGSTRGPAPAPPEYLGQDDTPRRAVVLCGPGNNGGDGFVVARLLAERGWVVEVFFYGRLKTLPPDAKANFERWKGPIHWLGFPHVTKADCLALDAAAYDSSGTDLIVDSIFGIGLTRPIDGLAPLFAANDVEVGVGERIFPARHVAIDVPSGMRADDPQPPGYLSWFLADLTVTFHRKKPVHLHRWTTASCGKVVVVDIGL